MSATSIYLMTTKYNTDNGELYEANDVQKVCIIPKLFTKWLIIFFKCIIFIQGQIVTYDISVSSLLAN